ncbi:hypothetical protein DXG01_000770 [Tephrocybe rancida]|nr:hypothetical protein DXG01_000770 [Tephrocybe rancida]
MQKLGRAALRVTRNFTGIYSDRQVKVRDATSNDPTGTLMHQIAQMTFYSDGIDLVEITDVLDRSLKEKAKNWRYILNSLTVVEYLLHRGSEAVVAYYRDNIDALKMLKHFSYIDNARNDVGALVRQKATDIVELISDEARMHNKRLHLRDPSRWRMGFYGADALYPQRPPQIDLVPAINTQPPLPSESPDVDEPPEEMDTPNTLERQAPRTYSEIQAKVRRATSNVPWIPSDEHMNEIIAMSYNESKFVEALEILNQRLKDKGKNWRCVFKSLVLIDCILLHGAEYIVSYFRHNIDTITALKDFQYVDDDGKDQGEYIRQEAAVVSALIQDELGLQKERLRLHPRTDGGAGQTARSSGQEVRVNATKADQRSSAGIEMGLQRGSKYGDDLRRNSSPFPDRPYRDVAGLRKVLEAGKRMEKLSEEGTNLQQPTTVMGRDQALGAAPSILDFDTTFDRPVFEPGETSLTPYAHVENDDRIKVLNPYELFLQQQWREFLQQKRREEDAQAQRSRTLSMLVAILNEHRYYQRLLKCTGSDAQIILELCQTASYFQLLDSHEVANDVRRQIVTAMQRLAAKSKSFPSYFFVHGPISLAHEYAISSGSFGDVYKATLHDETLCLKVLRANQLILQKLAKANVLVDRAGRAYLADFGLSNVDDPQIVHWTSQSSVGSKGGSARWQAPELHRAETDLDGEEYLIHNTELSDVFAWGCLCYEIFTGRLPFYQIRLATTVVLKIVEGQIPSRPPAEDLAWLEYELTESIWELMERCWLLDPSARPDMSSIVSALNLERPVSDTRPEPQWPPGSAMRFRNSGNVNASNVPNKHSLEDLNAILSRVTEIEG